MNETHEPTVSARELEYSRRLQYLDHRLAALLAADRDPRRASKRAARRQAIVAIERERDRVFAEWLAT